jgi:hypothetical protein
MPENENKDNFSSNTQFFGLCTFLVNENLLSKEIDQVKMLGEVIDKVKKHQSREEKGSSKKDQTLIGLLKLTISLINKNGVNEEVIEVCD